MHLQDDAIQLPRQMKISFESFDDAKELPQVLPTADFAQRSRDEPANAGSFSWLTLEIPSSTARTIRIR
jgi:hypothetical protein